VRLPSFRPDTPVGSADRETVTSSYDDQGNPQLITGSGSVYVYGYFGNRTALGQPQQVYYPGGGGVPAEYHYRTSDSRLSWTTNPWQGRIDSAYDPVGNVTRIEDHQDANRTQTFQYDDLDRIHIAQSPA
jgi:YD repeat-containing protein